MSIRQKANRCWQGLYCSWSLLEKKNWIDSYLKWKIYHKKKSKKVYEGSFFPAEFYVTTIFRWALGKQRSFVLVLLWNFELNWKRLCFEQIFCIFQVFLDKAAKRAVLGLVVKCDNNKRKCDWTGELSSIEVRDSSKFTIFIPVQFLMSILHWSLDPKWFYP